jgi:hypothetical protein
MDWNKTLSPALRELVGSEHLPPLGPGTPDRDAHAKLKALHINNAFAPLVVRDGDMAQCCLAGVWLLHNYLDESHRISQDIDTTSGSYWHALMHRREPDFGNSKYWFRRVGVHPVFEALRTEAARLVGGAKGKAAFLTAQTNWDPFAFVDLCEVSYDAGAEHHQLCRLLQRAEWDLLFGYCHAQAVGS